MRNKRDMIVGGLLMMLGIFVIAGSVRLKIGTLLKPLSGFFPLLAGITILVLSLILLYKGWRGNPKGSQPSFGNWQRPLIMVAGVIAYAMILESLGYIFSTIFIAALTLRLTGSLPWKSISVISFFTTIGTYLLFAKLLGVDLPAGILSFLE